MNNFLKLTYNSYDNYFWRSSFVSSILNSFIRGKRKRIDVNKPNSLIDFSNSFTEFFLDLYDEDCFNEIIILCIGTDRSTGDSLGPLIGSNLIRFNTRQFTFL